MFSYYRCVLYSLRLHFILPYTHTPILPYSHTLILPYSHTQTYDLHSVIILAFVKSQGKETKGSDRKGGVSETTALLSEQTDSLEGSLRDKVVRNTHPLSLFSYSSSSLLRSNSNTLLPQLQRENSTPSIQGAADDKLTFSSPSSRSAVVGGGGRASWEDDDVDFSWVDRLGVWPRRILYVIT